MPLSVKIPKTLTIHNSKLFFVQLFLQVIVISFIGYNLVGDRKYLHEAKPQAETVSW